jgi:hypothetical protein
VRVYLTVFSAVDRWLARQESMISFDDAKGELSSWDAQIKGVCEATNSVMQVRSPLPVPPLLLLVLQVLQGHVAVRLLVLASCTPVHGRCSIAQ